MSVLCYADWHPPRGVTPGAPPKAAPDTILLHYNPAISVHDQRDPVSHAMAGAYRQARSKLAPGQTIYIHVNHPLGARVVVKTGKRIDLVIPVSDAA
jgi:hypothetical protein